jgi:hypothetical protein
LGQPAVTLSPRNAFVTKRYRIIDPAVHSGLPPAGAMNADFDLVGKVPSAILRYTVERDSPVRANTVFRRMILSRFDMAFSSIG